jgi:hypothetical protein
LPTPQEALAEPFAAFPSWFLRIECDRCGKERLLNEAHISEAQRRTRLGVFLARARHEGCGGRAAKAELLTGTEAASSGPVRRMCWGLIVHTTPLTELGWRALCSLVQIGGSDVGSSSTSAV